MVCRRRVSDQQQTMDRVRCQLGDCKSQASSFLHSRKLVSTRPWLTCVVAATAVALLAASVALILWFLIRTSFFQNQGFRQHLVCFSIARQTNAVTSTSTGTSLCQSFLCILDDATRDRFSCYFCDNNISDN